MQLIIVCLLIGSIAVAVIVFLIPFGPIFVALSFLLYCLVLAIRDLARPFVARRVVLLTDEEYYSKFEPKRRLAIHLATIALGIYITGWLVGAFADPNKRPTVAILVADIIFTVVGFAFCFYARQNSETYFQTAFTWIPMSCWLVHSVILLGHGVQIN